MGVDRNRDTVMPKESFVVEEGELVDKRSIVLLYSDKHPKG